MGIEQSKNYVETQNKINTLFTANSNCEAKAMNEIDITNSELIAPSFCNGDSSLTINQSASSVANCDTDAILKSVKDIVETYNQEAKGDASNTSVNQTQYNFDQYIENRCTDENINKLDIKGSKINFCNTAFVQTADAASTCKVKAASDLVDTISKDISQKATGGLASILDNSTLMMIVGAVLLIVAIIFISKIAFLFKKK